MQRDPRGLSAYALVGSVAVHALVTWWLATREPAPARSAAAAQAVEFSLFEMPSSSVAVPDEPALSAPPAPQEAAARSRATATKTAAVARSTPAAPANVAVVASVATNADRTEHTSPAPAPAEASPAASSTAKRRDLSPLAAALTLRDSLAGPSRCEALLADAGQACRGENHANVSGAHGAGPDATRDALIALRKELHLKPRADGSYAFENPSFLATVQPDGRVMFEDKIRDLNGFVEHTVIGAEINTSEKRRFLESTATLREQLATAAEEQRQKLGKVALQSTLRRLLTDATLGLSQKRAAIFQLWDDCASDASGSAAQAAIESFVREHLPLGSALAYSMAELTQLNRRRGSRRSFDPYAVADAGTLPG